jgi:hypothetical protein
MHYKQASPSATTLPDGEYPFLVTGAEETTSSAGNEMIKSTVKIKDGPTVYDYFPDVESSWPKLDQFLASIGETINPGAEVQLKPHTWIGKTGKCVLYTDEYQGRKSNKISEYLLPPPKPDTGAPPSAKSSWK